MKNIFGLTLIAAVTFGAGAGFAEDEVVQEADRVVYSKKTTIDFSDVNVEGELQRPDGSYVKNRKRTKFQQLIDMRGNFRPELHRSADAL